MVEQNKECLIQISRYKFSLVISGLTKILQRVNESVTTFYLFNFMNSSFEMQLLFDREHMDQTMRKITMNPYS